MLKRMGLLALALALALASCKKKETPPPADEQKAEPSKKEEPKQKVAILDPFGLGASPTAAKAGDFVLCPPREWIDKAMESGKPENQTFIFYGAHMVEPGPALSKVTSQTGKEMEIPNYMIIPIRKGESAKPGDILLTQWQSGSGMQRAMVVEGGTPTSPKVRYLDMDIDNPSGSGKRVDTCKPDTFHKLEKAWEPGTSVAAKSGMWSKRWKIVYIKGDRVLGVGFAGKMKVLSRKDCTPVPVRPDVKPNTAVWVPYIGSYKEGKVKKVDAAIGRVMTEIEFAGKKKEIAAPFVDVLTEKPGS